MEGKVGKLNPREWQVFRLVAREGKTYLEVAEELGVNRNTVSGYVARITKKLGAKTLAQAVFIQMKRQNLAITAKPVTENKELMVQKA